ncbi:hypothetical protein CQW23_17899 [Capsicum baccatum]|uniref:F-box associated beta-propeller type 3 domain-containing protein n=1 Tax=Capsicum baccatum TaxID=33114 RepID=A0A2G2WF60_CAPBA|nr:hypothetical protein CQW23_17899 [Capsicum baccatum]
MKNVFSKAEENGKCPMPESYELKPINVPTISNFEQGRTSENEWKTEDDYDDNQDLPILKYIYHYHSNHGVVPYLPYSEKFLDYIESSIPNLKCRGQELESKILTLEQHFLTVLNMAARTGPEFTKYHLSLSANNNKDYTNHSVMWRIAQPGFNLKECPIMEETNLDYHMKNSGISCVIEGSVNGLICLVNEAKELFLWNPAIRKCKKLPDFRTKLKDDGQCTYGFGYDDIHDDYKLLCSFSVTRYPRNFQDINIYSLKDNSWRTIHCSRRVTRLIGSGKFVNGKLYWATSIDIKSGWSITSFHLRNEKWKKVEQHYFGEED